MSVTVSAIVLTKNEERNIGYCLDSLQWSDEIIVVDSGSKDNTLDIAEDKGAKIIKKKSNDGSFDHLRRCGIEKATNDWIFVLDADEICPKSLADKLIWRAESGTYDGFRVPRRNYLMDEPKNTAIWPDYQLRFHRADAVNYTEELHSFTDVAEDAKIENIDPSEVEPILHFSTQNVSGLISTINRYTSIEAEDKADKGYSFMRTSMKSAYEMFYAFGRNFLYKKGYKRPKETLLTVFTSAVSPWLLYFKKWQINEKGTDEEVLEKINDIREKEVSKYDGEDIA